MPGFLDRMSSLEIECLACGKRRLAMRRHRNDIGVCPGCGYVGWAEPSALTDIERRQVHRELAKARSGSCR